MGKTFKKKIFCKKNLQKCFFFPENIQKKISRNWFAFVIIWPHWNNSSVNRFADRHRFIELNEPTSFYAWEEWNKPTSYFAWKELDKPWKELNKELNKPTSYYSLKELNKPTFYHAWYGLNKPTSYYAWEELN